MWRLVACQVLPDLTRTAAARFSRPCSRRTHLPCSRLHARLADDIAAVAGGLLPHRFTPYQTPGKTPAGLLSVAVVVTGPSPTLRPHLLFRGAIFPVEPDGSREVPLPVYPDSDDVVALNCRCFEFEFVKLRYQE